MSSFKSTKTACYFGYVTGAVVNNLAPVLFVIFMSEFGLSYAKIAVLTVVNFIMQLIVDALSVRLVDKIGYRSAAVAAHIFAASGLIIMGLFAKAGGFLVLLSAVLIYAVGGGLIEVIITPIVEAIPGDCKSGQMSLLHSFYCWGQVFCVAMTTAVIRIFGSAVWPIICIGWAVIPICNAVKFSRVPLAPALSEETGIGVRELFRNRFFIVSLVMMLASGASELTMSQWASAFAERGLGVPKLAGDLLGPCAFAVLMGSVRALYGVLSDKIKIMPALIASSVLCIVCYLSAAMTGSGAIALIGCAVCGASVGLMWPGAISLTCEQIPGGRTAMFSFLALSGDMGCAVGPWLCGIAADVTSDAGRGILGAAPGISSGLICGVIFPVMMLVGLLFMKRHRVKTEESSKLSQ